MDYTSLFYWLVVADNAKTLFIWGIIIFTVMAIVSSIAYLVSSRDANYYFNRDGEREKQTRDITLSRKWMFWAYPLMFFWWSLYVFTPSKKDSLLIVAGGGTLNYLTTDSTAKQIPHELTNFVVTELKNMAKDNEIDLNIKSQKEKILNEAKEMTSEQILTKIKTDSTFKKVILEQ